MVEDRLAKQRVQLRAELSMLVQLVSSVIWVFIARDQEWDKVVSVLDIVDNL